MTNNDIMQGVHPDRMKQITLVVTIDTWVPSAVKPADVLDTVFNMRGVRTVENKTPEVTR